MDKKIKLHKKTSFERDVEFLVAHAMMHSSLWNEQLKFVDNSKFPREVKKEAEKRLDRDLQSI